MQSSQSCDQIKAACAALATRQDVAALLGVSDQALRYNLYASGVKESKYFRFDVRKKSGGVRPIIAPDGFIKIIQSRLHTVLQCVYEPKGVVQGFTLTKSIVSNADHLDQRRWVLNVDIAEFFPSINFGRVRGMLMASPYNLSATVATVLANICCVDNQLPQGAPTSPIIANMLCARLDAHLSRLSGAHRCSYTRYADDLTFSTDQTLFPRELAERQLIDDKLVWVPGPKLTRTIRKNGFQINLSKVRLQKYNQRQEVTGLITNERVNVPRKFVREIRAILHNIKIKGLADCRRAYEAKYASRRQRHPKAATPPIQLVVKGKIEFVGLVRGKDDDLYYKFLKELDSLIPDLVKVPVRKDQLDWFNENVWIIETDVYQGTGFLLSGVGLVTAEHVLRDAHDILAISSDRTVEHRAKIIARDNQHDLAILDIGHSKDRGFAMSAKQVQLGEPITLLGFPKNAPGDSVQMRVGHIAGLKKDPNIDTKFIILSTSVIEGNSGGPVLNKELQVIGVALRGAPNEREAQQTSFHAAMPIATVKALFAQSQQ
jgi:S1-C subfamily serine protease